MDVSDGLINMFADMAASQAMRYIPLEKATWSNLALMVFPQLLTSPRMVLTSKRYLLHLLGQQALRQICESSRRCRGWDWRQTWAVHSPSKSTKTRTAEGKVGKPPTG